MLKCAWITPYDKLTTKGRCAMKRVFCLYRVSTVSQSENGDIPMQREACHEFATSKGWIVTEEFSEYGVSGFKVPSEKREALQDIKKAAIQKRFDVLLVFMFDRLGRRDDETPFIVEWFVKNGIEVWSVVEGEQKFDDHVDKLLNYIRYWHASGESLKTSIRTKTGMEFLVREGLYVGGTPAFGYKICKLGRSNKRGLEVHDILVDPKEADIVKKIFDMYCSGQGGTHQIAVQLTEQGFMTRKGKAWRQSSISSILRNICYTGVRKFGTVQSEIIPHLQIIDWKTFAVAKKRSELNKLHKPNRGRSLHAASVLFADLLWCINCGKKMTITRNRKIRKNKNGTQTVYDRLNYICTNKSSNPHCIGQKSYSAKSIDSVLFEIITRFLTSKDFNSMQIDVNRESSASEQIERIEAEIVNEKQSLKDLKCEVVAVIQGTSAFGSLLIADLIRNTDSQIIELESEKMMLLDMEHKQTLQLSRAKDFCKQLRLNSGESLSTHTFGEKSELLKQLIDRIYLGSGYKYRIVWAFGEESRGVFGGK